MTKPIVGGRPLKFETPQDLIDAINKYFQDNNPSEYTVTGLALTLGTSKDVIDEYQKRPEYKKIVDQAKLYIENDYELDLRRKGGAHNIFALKNFGWKDKQEIDQNLNGNLNINQSKILDAIEQSNRLEVIEQGVENDQPIQDNQQAG
jgi:hypothetical protein